MHCKYIPFFKNTVKTVFVSCLIHCDFSKFILMNMRQNSAGYWEDTLIFCKIFQDKEELKNLLTKIFSVVIKVNKN